LVRSLISVLFYAHNVENLASRADSGLNAAKQ
jgi:hypothetical protein